MKDLHRGQFHLQPETNWMNDPNGPVMLKNGLHMFYQYNPLGAQWGNMSWGHALSKDLVHWKRLEPALLQGESYDKDGVFSGCCVVKDGLPHILYTGVNPQVQCLAVGDALGESFAKYAGNPVIAAPPVEGMADFRDPFAWEENGQTYIVVGGGYKGEGGVAFVYRSHDLKDWEYLGELCRGNDPKNDVWECPNLLHFADGSALLLVSLMDHQAVYAMEGAYEGGKLTPGKPYRHDLGDCYYAPNTIKLADGRYVGFGWLKETVSGRENAGWQGMMSLPREIFKKRDGTIGVRPVKELKKLRLQQLYERKNFTVHSGENPLKGIEGRQLEILVTFEAGADSLYLELLKSPKGEEKAIVTFDGAIGGLYADCSRAGGAAEESGGMTLAGGRNTMHVFVDGSAIEVFLNEQESLSTRAYPLREDACGLRLHASGAVRILSIEVYEMDSAYDLEEDKGAAE